MSSSFHVQNGTLNLETVETVEYSHPETAKGMLVAEVVTVTGRVYHFFGDVAVRLQKTMGWNNPTDGAMEEQFEPEAENAAETSAS